MGIWEAGERVRNPRRYLVSRSLCPLSSRPRAGEQWACLLISGWVRYPPSSIVAVATCWSLRHPPVRDQRRPKLRAGNSSCRSSAVYSSMAAAQASQSESGAPYTLYDIGTPNGLKVNPTFVVPHSVCLTADRICCYRLHLVSTAQNLVQS